jgi:uncharacterized protein
MSIREATSSAASSASSADLIRAELESLKASVAGVHGSLVATSDGLVVAHDLPGLEPTQIAAIAATTHALGARTTLAAGRGQLRETVAHGSDGYLAVYAVGDTAIIAVVGTPGLNVGMLHYQARDAIARMTKYIADLPASAPAGPRTDATAQTRGTDGTASGTLPRRRPKRSR